MCVILTAERDDLPEILRLQYLAYQSEAALFGSKDIPPLKQTIEELTAEYEDGMILKAVNPQQSIIGSVRARAQNGTVLIGKLMVHPDYRRRGLGSKLLEEIAQKFPEQRCELFTSTRSKDNILLYQRRGYRQFKTETVDEKLQFVYMEKYK